MLDPNQSKGVWEVAYVQRRTGKPSEAIVTHGYLRDWASIVKSTCKALDISVPSAREVEGDVFVLEFENAKDASTFCDFCDQ